MIELNLLPDVKMEYLKAQRSSRLVLSVAVLVSLVAVVLLILLLGFDGLQKKHLNDLKRDIATETSTLKNKPQINQILTIQNQLESLTALHAGKPAASRLFNYLYEVTPAPVTLNNFTTDFTAQTATITGAADSLKSVNQYVDTLKDAVFTTATNKTASPAFSNVVLSTFSINGNSQNASQAVSYTLTLSYSKTLFDITQPDVILTVPNVVTTRVGLPNPTDLFQAAPPSSSPTTSTSSGGN